MPRCAWHAPLGKDIKTDCSVNIVYNGKTHCFGNETAKQLFLKKPEEFLTQAQIYYSNKPMGFAGRAIRLPSRLCAA